jgi:amino acid transporter
VSKAVAMEKKSSSGPEEAYDINIEASSPNDSNDFTLAHEGEQLKRGLKSRHLQFLALGGAIGTGLFVGSGSILAQTGPAPLFMAYLSMSIIVYVVMNVLAEMTVYLPFRGVTIPYYVSRYVDPSLGFAAGWNYWYAYTGRPMSMLLSGSLLFSSSCLRSTYSPPPFSERQNSSLRQSS